MNPSEKRKQRLEEQALRDIALASHTKLPRPRRSAAVRNKCAAYILASCVENPWVSSSWDACFRHGCNRRWELSGMNPAVLRQQMGHSSAVMTARYTGEIPLDKVQEAFSKMELENMEVIGKRPRCTGSRLVVYNQQTRGMSGRRTMAV
jgi:hypothetical protein